MSIEIAKIAQPVSTRKKFLISSSTLCLSIVVQVVRFGLAVFFIMKCSDSGGEWASLIVSASWRSALGAAITLCFSVCSNTESEAVMSNISVLSRVLKFAIPHLTVGIVEALCKHAIKVCKITERMVDMTYIVTFRIKETFFRFYDRLRLLWHIQQIYANAS